MRIEISGLAESYDYYNEFSEIFSTRTYEGTVTGLDAANGTYILRSELEETMSVGCIVDGEESYPIGVYEEEFTLYYTETFTSYPLGGPCDDPLDTTIILREETFRLQVLKMGPHWYLVQLFGFGVSDPEGDLFGFGLSGCQVFACENNFDAATNGTLTDSQRLHVTEDEGGPYECSDGDIYFTPFGFSDESTSTVCGRARELATMAIVGTITATLE
jgi:hypothetical protein